MTCLPYCCVQMPLALSAESHHTWAPGWHLQSDDFLETLWVISQ